MVLCTERKPTQNIQKPASTLGTCGAKVLRYLEIILGDKNLNYKIYMASWHHVCGYIELVFVGWYIMVFVGHGKDHQPDHQPPLKHL